SLVCPFYQNVVFLAIDCEKWELDHAGKTVTEIGVAKLDTKQLGPNPHQWERSIETRHLLIREYRHRVNSRYVDGCPQRFHHGHTETVSIRDVPGILSRLFQPPDSSISAAPQSQTVQ